MKYLLILSLVALFAIKASAQQSTIKLNPVSHPSHHIAKPIVIPPPIIPIEEVSQYLGKQVTVDGRVINYSLAGRKVRYITVQDRGRHSTVNILITGSKVKLKAHHLKGSYFAFRGKVVAVKGTPMLVANEVEAVNF